jgi:hypothetical protein
MIGKGIPSNHNSAPFPNPMTLLLLSLTHLALVPKLTHLNRKSSVRRNTQRAASSIFICWCQLELAALKEQLNQSTSYLMGISPWREQESAEPRRPTRWSTRRPAKQPETRPTDTEAGPRWPAGRRSTGRPTSRRAAKPVTRDSSLGANAEVIFCFERNAFVTAGRHTLQTVRGPLDLCEVLEVARRSIDRCDNILL